MAKLRTTSEVGSICQNSMFIAVIKCMKVTSFFLKNTLWIEQYPLVNHDWNKILFTYILSNIHLCSLTTSSRNIQSKIQRWNVRHTFICTKKSLRCSLKAGISWFKLKSPVTNSLTCALRFNTEKIQLMHKHLHKTKQIFLTVELTRIHTYSCRWGNADFRRLATYSWINIWLFTGFPGFRGVLIFPSSTKLNMYARIDACIVKPGGNARQDI